MDRSYLPEGMRLGSAENREACASLAGLERAMHMGTVLEGVARLCDHAMDLHVDVGGFEGIIPYSEAVFNPDGQPVKDIAVLSRVGKPVCFRVMGIVRDEATGKPTLMLSRRAAQIDCYHSYLSGLCAGDIIPARVTHLESFGAFLDVGCGLVSLLSVDCISVSRIAHPRARLYAGMALRVAVKAIDTAHCRLYVTLRELLGTWEQNVARFAVGQTVTGIVRSVESYGVFVELAPNLAGLTELREEQKEDAPRWVGQSAAVFIKSILPERMKIKLVLIDTYPSAPTTPPLDLYIPEEVQHISRWVYSPSVCRKRVETLFDQ
ncbi:MAG: 30S ribosomal protein S1 [Clostridia bacterium]|nr:30S ribosomal protein S1 [Clostridia bacterium]